HASVLAVGKPLGHIAVTIGERGLCGPSLPRRSHLRRVGICLGSTLGDGAHNRPDQFWQTTLGRSSRRGAGRIIIDRSVRPPAILPAPSTGCRPMSRTRSLIVAGVLTLIQLGGLAFEIIATQPVRGALRTCTELFTIANRPGLSEAERLDAAR